MTDNNLDFVERIISVITLSKSGRKQTVFYQKSWSLIVRFRQRAVLEYLTSTVLYQRKNAHIIFVVY